MATQLFSRLFPKSTTATATPLSSAISFLRRLRPLSGAVITSPRVLVPPSFRYLSTGATTPWLEFDDPNRNYSTLKLRNGCDYYHCRVVMQAVEGDPTRDEIIDTYIKTLAEVVGSEDEARMMLYSVLITTHHYLFGTLLSKELSGRIERLPRVSMIFPHTLVNLENNVYEDDPFLKGPPIPLDHLEEWVRNTRARRKMV